MFFVIIVTSRVFYQYVKIAYWTYAIHTYGFTEVLKIIKITYRCFIIVFIKHRLENDLDWSKSDFFVAT